MGEKLIQMTRHELAARLGVPYTLLRIWHDPLTDTVRLVFGSDAFYLRSQFDVPEANNPYFNDEFFADVE